MFANCTHIIESSKSLEGDHGKDRVQRCHLLTSFQEGPHQCAFKEKSFQNSASKMANWIIVDIVKYLLALHVITSKLLATHFFLSHGVRRA